MSPLMRTVFGTLCCSSLSSGAGSAFPRRSEFSVIGESLVNDSAEVESVVIKGVTLALEDVAVA